MDWHRTPGPFAGLLPGSGIRVVYPAPISGISRLLIHNAYRALPAATGLGVEYFLRKQLIQLDPDSPSGFSLGSKRGDRQGGNGCTGRK